jgi:hypothetical protein
VHFAGYDLRPFLYPSRFPFQFSKIDAHVQALAEPDKPYMVADAKAKLD